MITTNERTWATVMHLSVLSQYFIPFGNFIIPILIWSTKKSESEFIDFNGKQVVNFQLSIFLYSLLFALIAIPICIYLMWTNVSFRSAISHWDFETHQFTICHFSGMIWVALGATVFFVILKVIEILMVLNAAVQANQDEYYKYPFTIPFFK
ncbi:DUF4870 domain-containing protein [Flavobacterium aciduliphilum]|uniref:Tic20 family protein n=1 Tax=Flavobacterium aciduliphilum TaxID=1101402 RepID=A0A328YQR8_9FLAO|nr:DUF4870 domain-containing protein [Flavobacterium aciduliphilum]RAR75483.1 hypothetical protein CLV55_101180 [Flavobacterium aciduliphilum]